MIAVELTAAVEIAGHPVEVVAVRGSAGVRFGTFAGELLDGAELGPWTMPCLGHEPEGFHPTAAEALACAARFLGAVDWQARARWRERQAVHRLQRDSSMDTAPSAR